MEYDFFGWTGEAQPGRSPTTPTLQKVKEACVVGMPHPTPPLPRNIPSAIPYCGKRHDNPGILAILDLSTGTQEPGKQTERILTRTFT